MSLAKLNIPKIIKSWNKEKQQQYRKDLAEVLSETENTVSASEEASIIGIPYKLGNLTVQPITLGSFCVLEYLNNSIIYGRNPQLIELYEFFYVLQNGKEVLPMVSAFARRRKDIETTRDLANTPEMYSVYLDKIAELADKYLPDWESKVSKIAEEIGDVPLTELTVFAETILTDAVKAFGLLSDGKDSQKKTAQMQKC